MVEIEEKDIGKYTPFSFSYESEFSSKFKKGPAYFCKIREKEGWDKVKYFI